MGKLHGRKLSDGRVSYNYRYYYENRDRRIAFGPIPKVTARQWESEAETELRLGRDPRLWWKQKTDENRESTRYQQSTLTRDMVAKYLIASRDRGNAELTLARKKLQLQEWFVAEFGEFPVNEISAEDLEVYISRRARGKSASTRDGYRRELRAFFMWCEKRGYVDRSPHRRMDPIRVPALTPKPTFTREQLQQLLLAMDKGTPVYRATVIAVHTAMRLSEVAGLTWEQVDFKHHLIQLPHTKSGKHQTVPLSVQLAEHMLKWKDEGHRTPVGYAHKSNVTKEFAKVRDRLGFPKPLTFQAIRRAVATWLLAEGESPFYVSKLLRHSSFAVTEASYANVIDSHLSRSVERVSLIINITD